MHERTLLLNVAEPQAVVEEMVRIARHGGVVVLQEPDSANWLCDPPHPAFGTPHSELLAAFSAAGKDFDQGRSTFRRLTQAGLTDVQVRIVGQLTRPGDYYQRFLLDRLSAELRQHLEQPGTITSMPNLWQAWGIKP